MAEENSWSSYGPLMVHLDFPSLTETAFGSHPYRIVSVSYGRALPFHGDNTATVKSPISCVAPAPTGLDHFLRALS